MGEACGGPGGFSGTCEPPLQCVQRLQMKGSGVCLGGYTINYRISPLNTHVPWTWICARERGSSGLLMLLLAVQFCPGTALPRTMGDVVLPCCSCWAVGGYQRSVANRCHRTHPGKITAYPGQDLIVNCTAQCEDDASYLDDWWWVFR